MHFRFPMFLCGTAALLFTGCSTAGKWISPLTQIGAVATSAATFGSDGDRTKSEPVISQARAPASAKPATPAAGNPDKAATTTAAATAAAPPSSMPLIQPGTPAAAPRPQFDSATLARIDAETRDASPDERSQLYRMLKDVNPADVEQVLRVRRMSIEFRKIQQNGPPALAGQTAPSSIASSSISSSSSASGENSFNANPALSGQYGVAANSAPHIAGGQGEPANGPGGVSSMVMNAQDHAGLNASSQHSNVAESTAGHRHTAPGSIEQAGYNTNADAGLLAGRNTGWTMRIGDTANQVALTSRQHEVQSPVMNAAAERDGNDREPIIHAAAAVAASERPTVVPASANTSADVSLRHNGLSLPESGTATLPPGIANSSSLSMLVAELEATLQQTPVGNTDAEHRQYTERHVMLRILYLLAGQQERAVQAIPSLEPADQEFWQQTLWGLANYFDKNPEMSAAARVSTATKAFNAAVIKLQERAALELRNVSFCDRILSYGSYQKFPVAEFTPGQPVLVYAELGNFVSERSQSGEYRTTLKSTLEIYRPGPNGELVEKIAIPNPVAEDLCRNQRRDFYLSYEFSIPSRLPSGAHVLKLIVEDQLSRKVASANVNFNVK